MSVLSLISSTHARSSLLIAISEVNVLWRMRGRNPCWIIPTALSTLGFCRGLCGICWINGNTVVIAHIQVCSVGERVMPISFTDGGFAVIGNSISGYPLEVGEHVVVRVDKVFQALRGSELRKEVPGVAQRTDKEFYLVDLSTGGVENMVSISGVIDFNGVSGIALVAQVLTECLVAWHGTELAVLK